jgi:hypothetical protein
MFSAHRRKNMSDYKLTATGKLFFASLVAVLQGGKSSIKLKGTPEQIKALTDVIQASKAFQEEVQKPDATIESVIEKMRLKNMAAADFKSKTNFPWPL